MTYPRASRDEVRRLVAAGSPTAAVARATGVSCSTVRLWCGLTADRAPHPLWISCSRCNPHAELDEAAYAYLLGLYLGDGTISRQAKGVWRLRIVQTTKYAELIDECRIEMQLVLPNNVHVQSRGGCVEIGSSSKHWPCLFPQHGPGMKHTRPIRLESWQQVLAQQYPKLLLRGLLQSDGCRNLNFVTSHGRRYDYWRYTFSNASDDIRGIFTAACDALGIHWTQMNARNVSIARRADVAFVDTFVGPKS